MAGQNSARSRERGIRAARVRPALRYGARKSKERAVVAVWPGSGEGRRCGSGGRRGARQCAAWQQARRQGPNRNVPCNAVCGAYGECLRVQ